MKPPLLSLSIEEVEVDAEADVDCCLAAAAGLREAAERLRVEGWRREEEEEEEGVKVVEDVGAVAATAERGARAEAEE